MTVFCFVTSNPSFQLILMRLVRILLAAINSLSTTMFMIPLKGGLYKCRLRPAHMPIKDYLKYVPLLEFV